MAPMKSSSTVCIVGAGPVGLFTALKLAQAGIEVAVFEREAAIVQSPRAMGYFDIIQAEFGKAGILDEIKSEGLLNDGGLNWRRPRDGDYLARLPGGPDPSTWPIQLGQHVVGEIILKHLAEFPKVQVHFNHQLETLEQLEANGSVVTRYHNGREHVSQFVVGTDGGKSTVRKLIGVKLNGFTWEDFQIIALNVDYDLASLGWAPGNAVLGEDIWGIVARIGKGNLWRVTYGLPTTELDPEDPYDEPRERARAQKKLALLLPGPTDEARIETISLYRIRQLNADAYVKGRVALAGDSAHVTSPIGGLGLTTGILDAALLARTLKKIIKESAPLSLLETYGEIRRDIFENIANPSAIMHTRMLTGKNAESVAMREEFIEKVKQRDFEYLKKLGSVHQKLSSTLDD